MATESIRQLTARDGKTYTYYPVLILGAGESGIALGCRLKQKLGTDQFRIFDRQAGIGGTWWINNYPGVACDVTTVLYSFSWAQKFNWSKLYPPGGEIVAYLREVCYRFQIFDKIQLNTDVQEARWLEDESMWEITLCQLRPGAGDLSNQARQSLVDEIGEDQVYLRREVVRAKVFASGAGGLVNPSPFPKGIPGKEDFEGDIFHSARWDYNVDLTNKDVIIVGSGSSACQFVGKLTKAPYNAKSVTQVMRTAPWVTPQIRIPINPLGIKSASPYIFGYVPFVQRFLRAFFWSLQELVFVTHFGTSAMSRALRERTQEALKYYMRAMTPEKYHKMLVPDFDFGCKRAVIDYDWFSGLNEPNIDLTTRPLRSVGKKSIRLGPERVYDDEDAARKQSSSASQDIDIPADVIVLATGFETGEWLHPLKITGKHGRTLSEVWKERGGAQAYLGSAMDGFPNFYLIFGPNTVTGHTSVVSATEGMVEHSLNFIKPVLNGEARQVEVKESAERRYTNEIQDGLSKTVFYKGGCSSWYMDESGWNSTTYPFSQVWFHYYCMFPKWHDWDIQYTRKGLVLNLLRQGFKLLLLSAFLFGAFRANSAGYTLSDVHEVLSNVARTVIDGLVFGLGALRRKIA